MTIDLNNPNVQFFIFAGLGLWTAIVYGAGYKRDEEINGFVIAGALSFALVAIINLFRILISKL